MSQYPTLDAARQAKDRASRRTFTRMLKAALFSESTNRTARYQTYGDVRVIPETILLTEAQADALKVDALTLDAETGDLVITPSGTLVFMGVPVTVTHSNAEAPRLTDAVDMRELPLRWDEHGPVA